MPFILTRCLCVIAFGVACLSGCAASGGAGNGTRAGSPAGGDAPVTSPPASAQPPVPATPGPRPSGCTGGIFALARGAKIDTRKDPILIRERAVTVEFSKLEPFPARLVLNLFDDVCVVAIRDRGDAPGDVWTGTVEGSKNSSVSLVIKSRTVIGSIVSPPKHFQIRLLRDSVHVVRQVDPSKSPRESPPRVPK
jgi:hypothetical protein